MRTIDRNSDANESLWAKVKHDLALARQLLGMSIYYWTKGRKLRAEYRRCQERGEVFYVDEDPAEPEKRVR